MGTIPKPVASSPTPAPPPPSGWQYATRIVLGCLAVWTVFGLLHHPNPLWALISVIIVTEPELGAAVTAFHSRSLNTLIGCAIALLFLYFLGAAYWSVLLAILVSVIVCTSFIRVPGSWRMAPVTVAILMVPSVYAADRHAGLAVAFDRMEEVLVGSAVALLITWAAAAIQRFLRSFIT